MDHTVESCPICGNKSTNFNISQNSLRFLEQRLQDKTLDEAITLSSIAWNSFPTLRVSADSKALISNLLKGIQEQVTNALTPIDMITKMVYPLNEKLEGLTATLPEGVKKEFSEISTQLNEQLRSIHEAATSATEPVQRDLKELTETIYQLINKPITKGIVNEETLRLGWQEVFVKDKTLRKGGAGQEDLAVIPFLEFNGQRFGQKIIVERKAGKQKYTGNHLQEAIEHAKKEGSCYAILVYDKVANLLELQKPFYLTISDGITIAVTDTDSGSWKTAREIFEVFQSVLSNDAADNAEKIDLAKLLRTIEEMQSVNNQIEILRKNNNSALASCEKIRATITNLEELITGYQRKLKELLVVKKPSQILQSETPQTMEQRQS
jgi:gas vesicle protein